MRYAVRLSQIVLSLLCLCLLLLLNACKDRENLVSDSQSVCPSLRIVAPAPYGSPVWHPSGQFIGFNHTPLKEVYITYTKIGDRFCITDVVYGFQGDSTGFWLMNTDGSNMRRALSFGLGEPAWSPDGQWIAFEYGRQIWKMRFTGMTFDTSSIAQLTTEGRNFYPAWSPDGQWIAYERSLADSSGPAGIWVMRNDGTDKRFVARGGYPHWSVDGSSLIYVGLHSEIFRVMVSDTSKVFRLTSFNQSNPYARDNRYPRYSPDGTKIAFVSRPIGEMPNIWVMNADGSGPHQITIEGTLDWLSWSPDSREIVYVAHNYADFLFQNEQNGTIWSVDVITGQKRQLTFNSFRKYIKYEK